MFPDIWGAGVGLGLRFAGAADGLRSELGSTTGDPIPEVPVAMAAVDRAQPAQHNSASEKGKSTNRGVHAPQILEP